MKATMRNIYILVVLILISSLSLKAQNMNIYDIKMESLSGDTIDFADFKGKKLLIVNVASKCGFTPQYAGLQELHEEYGEDVTILGVPCNQFGGQEPGSHEEIAEFCQKNYGVSFLITEKVDVKGKEQHPLYTWLTNKEQNGVEDSSVKWNFHKYIIDEEGNLIGEFGSRTEPMSEEIINLIKK